LSARWIRRAVRGFRAKRIGDFGCGYNARFVRSVLNEVNEAWLVDVALADDLKAQPRIRALEGALPTVLIEVPSNLLDVVLCISVLEHLWEPEASLREISRILKPGGVCLVNVPSWRGKTFLEYSAFKLGWSPREEMDDHKNYYDPRDLWPLLVRSGFVPHLVRCGSHKWGLNTYAVCQKAY
jgi:SAM-dependent methyltransferase